MTLDTYRLRRKYDLGFALETTTGTLATVAVTDAITRVFNGDMVFNTETVERQAQGIYQSPILQGLGARAAALEFESELNNGSSGTPLWCRLLQGCGYHVGSGATWTPLTGPTQTLSFVQYIDGLQKSMAGAMGSFVLTCKRGQAARFKWSFQGVAMVPADATFGSIPAYVNTVAPRVGSAAFTVGGATFRVDQVEIDAGNTLYLREDTGAVDNDSPAQSTGYRAASIPGRQPKVRFSPEAVSLATHDWYSALRNSQTAAMSLTIGNVANQTFTITAPALQLINNPKDGDRQGLHTQQLEFLATGVNGDDELAIALS